MKDCTCKKEFKFKKTFTLGKAYPYRVIAGVYRVEDDNYRTHTLNAYTFNKHFSTV